LFHGQPAGEASERPKFLLWAVKGTFTAWKLPTRLSFEKIELKKN
jgi:hypothetical protein